MQLRVYCTVSMGLWNGPNGPAPILVLWSWNHASNFKQQYSEMTDSTQLTAGYSHGQFEMALRTMRKPKWTS